MDTNESEGVTLADVQEYLRMWAAKVDQAVHPAEFWVGWLSQAIATVVNSPELIPLHLERIRAERAEYEALEETVEPLGRSVDQRWMANGGCRF